MPDIAKQFEDVADDFRSIFTQNASTDEMTFHLYRTATQAGGVAWDAAKAIELNKLSGAVESAEKLWESIQQAREKSEVCKELLSVPDDIRHKIEKALGKYEYYELARSLFWPEVVMPWAWEHETLKPHSMRSPYSSLNIEVSMPCGTVRTGENSAVEIYPEDKSWPNLIVWDVISRRNPFKFAGIEETDTSKQMIRQFAQDSADVCRLLASLIVSTETGKWLTLSDSARHYLRELDNTIGLPTAKTKIRRACRKEGGIINKGERSSLRINQDSLNTFILAERNKQLEE